MSPDLSEDSVFSRQISGNTVKGGSGTEYRLVCNDDGQLVVEITGTTTISGTVNIQDGGNSITIDNADITSIKNAVQIMDDWDSGDKCKVYLYGDDSGTPRLVQVNASGQLIVYTP